MPGGNVAVSITANTAGFTAGMSRVSSSAKTAAGSVKSSFDQGLSSIAKNSGKFDQISGSLLKIGAVGAVGLAAVGKAAMDWESQWAGVTKTVDGSAEQMGVLEGQLRGLAKTLPASHQEIAAVAEAAGQLGVQRESIASFTKTMIDLGETTNLSADEAATSIAQLMNVMGTAPENVGRLGSTLVALGNAGASTEKDILQMGQRIAGAGVQIGLTEGEVLGFASAISSVGIEVEAGGTAISTTFLKIDQAVRDGGEGLNLLAKTAGVSSADFRTAFQTNAAGAINSFVQGLGRIQTEGGNVNEVLKDLGIKGVREGDTLRRLASSGTILSDSLKLQGQAWKDNNALLQEAATRYATTESQARVAWNQIKDAAITGGQAILPIVAEIATGIGKVAEVFGSMPGPARQFAAAVLVAGTAMALVGGGTLKAVTGLATLRTSFVATAGAATAAGRAMKIAQLSIPVVGVALFAVTAALQAWAGSAATADASAAGFASAMQTVEGSVTAATAALNENVRAAAVQSLQSRGALDQAKLLGLSLTTLTDAALGSGKAMTEVGEAIKRTLLYGNGEQVKAALELGRALNITGAEAAENVRIEQQRREAMNQGSGASKDAAAAAEEHAAALQQEQAALEEMADAAQAASNAILQMSGSQIGLESAIDAATKAAKDNGDTLDVNTEKGRNNQQALNSVAAATLQYTNQLVKAGASADTIVGANERGRASFIKTAQAMGASKKEATELASALFTIPDSVQSQVVVAGSKVSKKEAEDLNKALKDIPAEQRAKIVTIAETKGAKAAKQAMAEVKDKQVIARSTSDLKGAKAVKSAMAALKDRLVKAISRDDQAGVKRLKAAMASLKNKTVTVTAQPAGVGETQRAINSIRGKQVSVTVKKVGVATGGLVTPAGPIFRSGGGPVWGAGSATSDSIPAMLSNGEYVIKADSALKLGIERLQHMNQTGTVPTFAKGGPVGFATGGIVSAIPKGVDINRIYAMIVALSRPLAAVQSTQALYAKAVTALARENREVASARRAVLRGGATKAEKANLAKQQEQQKAATDKLTEATKNLRDAQQAVADAARSMSQTLSEPYRSKSNDVDDWLESMRTGAVDLKAFQGQIAQLRKLGVSETLVQQITEKGAIAGAEVAQQIIAGGKALTNALNTANGNLQKSADALGYDVVQATGRFAAGGFVSGPGSGVSDSINARLSNGEYVMNARATAMNRSVLDAMNYGRSSQQSFLPAYAHGGYVHNANKEIRGGDFVMKGNVYVVDPDEFMRKGQRSLRDSLNAASLRI